MITNRIHELFIESKVFEDPNNQCKYIVHYGSKKFHHDIDLLVVYQYEPENYHICIGKLDIFTLSIENFEYLLSKHDLIVSEPLLNGTILKGENNKWREYIENYIVSKPDTTSIFHSLKKSLDTLESTKVYLNLYRQKNLKSYEKAFWNNLSFAYSYLYVALLYKKGVFPVTTKLIIQEQIKFSEIKRIQKSNITTKKDKKIDLMEGEVNSFCTKYINLINDV